MTIPTTMRSLVISLVLVAAACSSPTGETTLLQSPGSVSTGSTSSTATTPSQPPAQPAVNGPLLGFTPFPSAPTTEAVVQAFEIATSNGSLFANHFDRGIPWETLLSGEPLPEAFAAELGARRAESRGQVIYVATAITNFERDDIPDGLDGAPRPSSLDGAGPASPEVERALKAWVDLLVAELDPDYLNVGVEIDLAVAKRPELANDLMGLYRSLYEYTKDTYPNIVVFASFQAEIGDPSVVAALADATDLIAISTYPYFDGEASVPDADYLDRFFDLGVDVAIAETGFPAGSANTPVGEVTSSPEQQDAYMRWLLDQACAQNMAFVVWFLPGDIDTAAWGYTPDQKAIAGIFATNGLHDTGGTAYPSFDRWTAAVDAGCPG
ncbi:hypothetical protein MNBD_ACTINO02-1643 [hydrothermal vent metagenome]|uniref:Arabinogalactan endo-beta-1,4-galactanase n=1 Tax=hydrothermal vent metagenome TaxID=652676 RepID=A0A3B0TRL8_9ZZZZ